MEENLEKDKAALEGAVVEGRLQRGFAVNAGNYAAPTSQKENRKSVGGSTCHLLVDRFADSGFRGKIRVVGNFLVS